MKIYKKSNVLEEANKRINFLFDNFDNVIVSFSGGKDSTVIFELTMEIATKRNRLPLGVLFVDQEAELPFTIDIQRKVMYRDDVKPHWYQIPIKIENSATFEYVYQTCWNPEQKWLREKEDCAIKENTYNCPKWDDGIFSAIAKKDFPPKTALIAGMRTEETPKRYMGLAFGPPRFKGMTWAKFLDKKLEQFTFYPIYDWSYTDVWKYIYDNKIEYNKMYDYHYRYGVSLNNMRVSNLHHETAVYDLFWLQEIDAPFYNKLVERMPGIDTAGKMDMTNFRPKKLPSMFSSWEQYRDYLATVLIPPMGEDKDYDNLHKTLAGFITLCNNTFEGNTDMREKAAKVAVDSIICGDVTGTKIRNFRASTLQFYINDKKRYEQTGTTVKASR